MAKQTKPKAAPTKDTEDLAARLLAASELADENSVTIGGGDQTPFRAVI